MQSLRDPEWLRSFDHKQLVAEQPIEGASAAAVDFIGRLCRRGAKLGIPLVCDSATGDVVFIVHGRRGRDLHALEWEVIAHLGGELVEQYRLGFRWGGLMMPSCWMGEAAQGPSAPSLGPS